MATYLENALWDFIKTILTRGIRTLKSPRFFPYTLVLLLIMIVTTISAFTNQLLPNITIDPTINDLFMFLELGAAIAFILIGLVAGRARSIIQIPLILAVMAIITLVLQFDLIGNSVDFSLYSIGALYIIWIGITTFSTFALFRDLFASNIFGTVLFLGKPEDDGEVMFGVVAWLLVFADIVLGYMILREAEVGKPLFFTAIVIILLSLLAAMPLLGVQKKNDVFYTVLSSFFMFASIKVFLLAFRTFTATEGSTSYWDTIFSLFMALYAIQGAAVKGVKIGAKAQEEDLEDKLMEEEQGVGITRFIARILSDRGIVLVILGVLMGFHAMQVQTIGGRENILYSGNLFAGEDIVLLGYQVNLLVTLFIYIASLVLFFIFPPFKNYANPEVKRIPWAPPYNDLKLMLAGIKDGEIAWKQDAAKLAIGIIKDKVYSKVGKKTDTEGRISSTIGKWLKESKK